MSTDFHLIKQFLEEGLTVALATIVEVKGSVPREVGAKMIVHPLGKHIGTVGGGCGEGWSSAYACRISQSREKVLW